MAIPLTQLETWSNRPDPGRSADTYNSIKNALAASASLRRYFYDVYLQGSYANATNIRADSDVDVVVELTSAFRSDLSGLTSAEKARFDSAYSDATLTLDDFRRDVLSALRSYYGSSSVSEGNKCVKVAGSGQRLAADVLVALQYRVWRELAPDGTSNYVGGVIFRTRDGREVINFPKEHRNNGAIRQAVTSNRYKGLVRTVKNARRKLVADGKLTRDIAPSYYVECLLYNAPSAKFVGEIDSTYQEVLAWLCENTSLFPRLLCQNEITNLFGSEPEQWDTWRANSLVNALATQWNEWRL
jgi:hypothetical protein